MNLPSGGKHHLTHDTWRVFKTPSVQALRSILPEPLGPGHGPGECSKLQATPTCSPRCKTKGSLVFSVAFSMSGKSTRRRVQWGSPWSGGRSGKCLALPEVCARAHGEASPGKRDPVTAAVGAPALASAAVCYFWLSHTWTAGLGQAMFMVAGRAAAL